MKKSTEALFAFLILGIFAFTLFSLIPNINLKQILSSLREVFQGIPPLVFIGLVGLFLVGFGYSIFAGWQLQQRRDEAKHRIIELLKQVKTKVNNVIKPNPQHRPAIDDEEAVRMKLQNPKMSYRQVYDKLYPPEQDSKKEQAREQYFNSKWRSRISQKVNEELRKEKRKYSM